MNTRAVAYLRTSSATNVGDDKDSAKRQREAIQQYADRNGIEIVSEYYDAAVSGADPVMDRPGFAEMFDYVSGVAGYIDQPATILIENASRFARDLAVQIAGHDMLVKHGITLIPVDAPEHFKEDTPTAVMVRQILGAVSQFEKDNLVSKLRKARDRKRESNGKCEGRKSHAEMDPYSVGFAKRHWADGKTLRWIVSALASEGRSSMATGRPYSVQAISSMVRQKVAS